MKKGTILLPCLMAIEVGWY